MSESYEQYEPPSDGAGGDGAPEREVWCVIVEYSNSGDRKPPTILKVLPGRHRNRTEAMAAAARQAFEYRPPDPMSPQGREVFQVDDGYVVIIAGAVTTFHISLRAARVVGTADQ